jgi:hypothetical protein
VELLRRRLAEMNGVARPPTPKKMFRKFRTVARRAGSTSLPSAFAAVTIIPPPQPSRKS